MSWRPIPGAGHCWWPAADCGAWPRWHRLREQGTHLLLWRIERRKARRVQDVLSDGSYLARIEANRHSKAAGTLKASPAPVRVIEDRVDVSRVKFVAH
ncbi:hypothetical protein [Streptomyces sp. V4I8]|uniref:hypothetical protein n=1 Tax=Streptomyces sp. V4I8 TaxID=3156469 RepID=UPI0035128393